MHESVKYLAEFLDLLQASYNGYDNVIIKVIILVIIKPSVNDRISLPSDARLKGLVLTRDEEGPTAVSNNPTSTEVTSSETKRSFPTKVGARIIVCKFKDRTFSAARL